MINSQSVRDTHEAFETDIVTHRNKNDGKLFWSWAKTVAITFGGLQDWKNQQGNIQCSIAWF